MKISFAAMAALATATPVVQDGLFGSSEDAALKQKQDTLWYAAGIKGYYQGFYKQFYKMELPEASAECMNKETMENIINLEHVMTDPMAAFGNMVDIQKDMNMFTQMAEIMENLSVCHFEQSAFDIMSLCTKDFKACDMGTITQNMSKDMFVLIGKMTSLAEIMQGFPSKDKYEFEEQMRELGGTGGTWARVMFNFHHPGEETEHHYHHSSDFDY